MSCFKRMKIIVMSQYQLGETKTYSIPKFLPKVAFYSFILILGLSLFFSYHQYNERKILAMQISETEIINNTAINQKSHLEAIESKISLLEMELSNLRQSEVRLTQKISDVSLETGLKNNDPLTVANKINHLTSWTTGLGAGESNYFSNVKSSSLQVAQKMQSDLEQLILEAQLTNDSLENFETNLNHLTSILSATPYQLPIKNKRLSSDFGYRRSPFGKVSSEFHRGLDIPTAIGTAVYAPADGIVLSTEWTSGYGRMMVVNHGYGLLSRYAHLSKTMFSEGDIIKRGEIIALSGNSGRSTGPHLHYETILAGIPVDPLKFTVADAFN